MTWINALKVKGFKIEDARTILNEINYSQSDFMEENGADTVYGLRFETLYNELWEYCDGPYFWSGNFESYIQKWENEIGVIKYIP